MDTDEQQPLEEISPDLGCRPIKTVSIQQIEQAFSKTLGELTGKAYKVNITKLDLNPYPDAWFYDSSNIELSLSEPTSSPTDDQPF
ncbi:MAG: hypothetical protein QX198_05800 [Methylococcaceae bacterium]